MVWFVPSAVVPSERVAGSASVGLGALRLVELNLVTELLQETIHKLYAFAGDDPSGRTVKTVGNAEQFAIETDVPHICP